MCLKKIIQNLCVLCVYVFQKKAIQNLCAAMCFKKVIQEIAGV